MPVTKSAKKAQRVSERRHEENLISKYAYKKAIKTVRKAVETGVEEVASLFSAAQSALDKAAKTNSIHPNKAARLKSRLNKKMVKATNAPAEEVKVKKASTPRKTTKKVASKKK